MSDTTHLRTSAPFDGAALLAFLAARAIPGVEVVEDGAYSRTLSLPGGPAVISARPDEGGVSLTTHLADAADQPKAIALVRHLFGLDQDPAPVIATLSADPALAPLIATRPGLRVPGTVEARTNPSVCRYRTAPEIAAGLASSCVASSAEVSAPSGLTVSAMMTRAGMRGKP